MEKKVTEHTNEDFEEKYKAEIKERMESEARLSARIDALEERLRVAEERARVAEERAIAAEERARVAENERDVMRQMYLKQHDEVVPPVLPGNFFYDEWKRKWKLFLLYINEL